MKKRLKEFVDARKAKLDRIDAILSVGGEQRDLTSAEQTEHDGLVAEVKALDKKIQQTKEAIALRDNQEALEVETRDAGAATPRTLASDVHTGPSEQEMRDLQKYSFVKAIRTIVTGGKLDGLEGEMHKEGQIEQRAAQVEGAASGSLVIPQLVLNSAGARGAYERLRRVEDEERDNTATGGSLAEGGFTIATQLGSLIDRLRNKLIMRSMGLTILGGLQGNIAFPKVAPDEQAVEKAETAVSAESSATFSQISMAPRRLPVFAEVSRQLLMQSSTDVEGWLRNELAFQIAQVMDNRAINGSGTAQPFGILNMAGVGAVALGTNGLAPTYDMIVDLETTVANLNADLGALNYLTNTKTRGKLKKTLVAANTAAQMIWDRQNPASPLNSYNCGITNLVPSNLTKGTSSGICSAMIFGNFNDALLAQWGGLEFLVNPYSRDTEGIIRLNVWTFYDFLVRRVESFAVCKDILTT